MFVRINLHSTADKIEFSLISTTSKSCGRRGCCAELGRSEEHSFTLNKSVVSLVEAENSTNMLEISNYTIGYFVLFAVLILLGFVFTTTLFEVLGDIGALSVAIGIAVGLSMGGKVLLNFLIIREIMPKFKIYYANKN